MLKADFFQNITNHLFKTLDVSADYFLYPNLYLPAVTGYMVRIIRCRLETYPYATDYALYDDNCLTSLYTEKYIVLSASFNPIKEVIPGISVFALNLNYTLISAIDTSYFPSLVSLSIKGCYLLRSWHFSNILYFLDCRETRICYLIKDYFKSNVKMTLEEVDLKPFYYYNNYQRIWFEDAKYYLDFFASETLFNNYLAHCQKDIYDLYLLNNMNNVYNYVNKYEEETLQTLKQCYQQLLVEKEKMYSHWKQIIYYLKTEFFIRNFANELAIATYCYEIYYNQGKYEIINSYLRDIAVKIMFENVEINGKEVMFDPYQIRRYLANHVYHCYLKINNSNSLKFAAEGYLCDEVPAYIMGNDISSAQTPNCISCEVYYSETLNLYVLVPRYIYIQKNVEILQYLKYYQNEYELLIKQYLQYQGGQAIELPYFGELNELFAQRMTFSNLHSLDLHNCGLANSYELFELINQLPDVNNLNLAFNNLRDFSCSSSSLVYLDLQSNILYYINLYCEKLQSLNISDNNLLFLDFFMGIKNKSKYSIYYLSIYNNAFDVCYFDILPSLCRYFKNLRVVNNIYVYFINLQRNLTICDYDTQLTQACGNLSVLLYKEDQCIAEQHYLAPSIYLLNSAYLTELDCSYCYYFQIILLKSYLYSVKSLNIAFCNVSYEQFNYISFRELEALNIIGNRIVVTDYLLGQLKEFSSDCIEKNEVGSFSNLTYLNVQRCSLNLKILLYMYHLQRLFILSIGIPKSLYLLPEIRQINEVIIGRYQQKEVINQLTSSITRELLYICDYSNYQLDISNTYLQNLQFEGGLGDQFSALVTIICNNNKVQGLESITLFPSLQKLIIKNNYLEFPFYTYLQCQTIKYLDLSSNPIKNLKNSLFSLVNLKVLIMYNTKIYSLTPNSFAFCPNLEELDISNNMFLTISKEALSGLDKLTKLNVCNSCRNNLEIALRVRSHLKYFNCYRCKLMLLETVQNFCRKGLMLEVIECDYNPFCMLFYKQNKSYIFELLEQNTNIKQINDYKVTSEDVHKILLYYEEYEYEKKEEINRIIMGTYNIRRNSSYSARDAYKNNIMENKLEDLGAMKICGILPRVYK